MSDILSWPCPYCASFTLQGDNNLTCNDCGKTLSRSQYRISMEYAAFSYRYGHLFRSVYQGQIEKDNKVTPVSLGDAHPIALATSLVILSAIHSPTTNWFLIRQTVKKFTASYLENFGEECALSDDELKDMNKNIREFTNDFSETLPSIRNAVFEEIFSEHCSKTDNETLLSLREKVMKASDTQRAELAKEFDDNFQKIMAKTFKKVGKIAKPTPEELGSFWCDVLKTT
ncbi:MAG: hypothetical protein OCC45_11900 [Desulfotalea sp.]